MRQHDSTNTLIKYRYIASKLTVVILSEDKSAGKKASIVENDVDRSKISFMLVYKHIFLDLVVAGIADNPEKENR